MHHTTSEYSGVTAKMLEEVSTRIEHVQAHLLSLIQKTDVIVGHSLENDLKALRILHTNVVDTSVIFRGGNGRKYGENYIYTFYKIITDLISDNVMLYKASVILQMSC